MGQRPLGMFIGNNMHSFLKYILYIVIAYCLFVNSRCLYVVTYQAQEAQHSLSKELQAYNKGFNFHSNNLLEMYKLLLEGFKGMIHSIEIYNETIKNTSIINLVGFSCCFVLLFLKSRKK